MMPALHFPQTLAQTFELRRRSAAKGTVVHDKAHSHDQVDHRNAVQVQAPKDNVA